MLLGRAFFRARFAGVEQKVRDVFVHVPNPVATMFASTRQTYFLCAGLLCGPA